MGTDDAPAVPELWATAADGGLLHGPLPASALVRESPNTPTSVNALIHPIRIRMRRSQPAPCRARSPDGHRMLAAKPVMLPCGGAARINRARALAIRV